MRRITLTRIVALCTLASAIAFGLIFRHQLKQVLDEFLKWTDEWGLIGLAVFVGVYVLATVLFLPGLILTLAGGFTFGLLWGTIGVSIGSTLGAAVAFLLGRTLLRDTIESRVADSPKFAAVDRAVGRQGGKIVLLVRLSPIFPFNLTNYAFGLTSIGFWPYVLASWIGMMPATVMYVYLGSAASSLAEIRAGHFEGGMTKKILLGVGLVATVVVAAFVSRLARTALRHDVPLPGGSDGLREP